MSVPIPELFVAHKNAESVAKIREWCAEQEHATEPLCCDGCYSAWASGKSAAEQVRALLPVDDTKT